MGGVVDWLDDRQRRHPALGGPLAVVYKFFDDQGFYLAALIAFYAFISLFPLFFLFSTILGLALENDPGLRTEILESAARQIPVLGKQIETQELQGSSTVVTVASLTALFGSLGVAQAIQNAMNVTWGIRRNERPNPVTSRVRSVGLLAVLGLFVVATTLISQIGSVLGERLSWFDNSSAVFLVTGSFVLSTIFFVVICRLGTARPPEVAELIPGAVLGAAAWQILQGGGNAFVTTVVARVSVTNGVLAVVLGLLAWLYLAAILLVLCLETNVVYARRLYPRSLLTPMTDRVDLTEADRQAYARLVRAQSLKGFQNVEVTFDHDGQYASARRRERENQESAATRMLRLRDGLAKALPATMRIPVLGDPFGRHSSGVVGTTGDGGGRVAIDHVDRAHADGERVDAGDGAGSDVGAVPDEAGSDVPQPDGASQKRARRASPGTGGTQVTALRDGTRQTSTR